MVKAKVRIHFLDVGHGDSVLVEFDDVSFGIVDCNRGTRLNTGFGVSKRNRKEPRALAFFRSLVEKGKRPVVLFACVSHPHFDHYNGMAELLLELRKMNIAIQAIWDYGASVGKALAMCRYAAGTDLEKEYVELQRLIAMQELLIEEGSRYLTLKAGTGVLIDANGITVQAIAPPERLASKYANFQVLGKPEERRRFCRKFGKECQSDNAISSCLRVSFGAFCALLCGDVMNEAWSELLTVGTDLSCDVFKVSHHGSREGSYTSSKCEVPICTYLRRTDGSKLLAVISGGYRVDLPHDQVIQDMRDLKVDIRCTGPMVRQELKPFVPRSAKGDLRLENIPFTGAFVEPKVRAGVGDGDVIIEAESDGSYVVSAEYAVNGNPG